SAAMRCRGWIGPRGVALADRAAPAQSAALLAAPPGPAAAGARAAAGRAQDAAGSRARPLARAGLGRCAPAPLSLPLAAGYRACVSPGSFFLGIGMPAGAARLALAGGIGHWCGTASGFAAAAGGGALSAGRRALPSGRRAAQPQPEETAAGAGHSALGAGTPAPHLYRRRAGGGGGSVG